MKKRKINIKTIISLAVVITVIVLAAYVLRAANQRLTYGTYPLKYENEVKAALEKVNAENESSGEKKVKVDEALVYAVIKTESNFDPDARSSAGAMGLMQIMPDTFTWLQTYYIENDSHRVEDLYTPEINIEYGVQLLSILLNKYESEDAAVCAYNAGIVNVDEWLQNPEYSDDGKTLKAVPFEETDNYRKKVARNKSVYTELYFNDDSEKSQTDK